MSDQRRILDEPAKLLLRASKILNERGKCLRLEDNRGRVCMVGAIQLAEKERRKKVSGPVHDEVFERVWRVIPSGSIFEFVKTHNTAECAAALSRAAFA